MMGMIYGIGIINLCVYMIAATPTIRLNSVLSYMNEKVTPCDNFYGFVCGNYGETLKVNDAAPIRITRQSDEDIVKNKLYDSIKRIDVATETFRHRKLVKQFFDMCMDFETRRVRSPESLLEIIQKLHGSPMLENDAWNEENWRWENVYNEAIKLGIPTSIFLIDIDIQKQEDSSLALRIRRPSWLGVDDDYPTILAQIQNENELDVDRTEKEFQELRNFENNLSQMKFDEVSLETNLTYVRENFRNIDWNKLFDLSAFGIELEEESKVITLENVEYLSYINNITVSKRVLANYQIMKFLKYAKAYLHWELPEQLRSRKVCIDAVRVSLPYITDAIFIQDHFDKDIKNDVLEMIANIKEQFRKAINSISWVDQSARDFAIEKLEATKYIIGYPEELIDNELLDEFYRQYELVEGDYLKSALRINFCSNKRKILYHKTLYQTSIEAEPSWIETNAYNHNDKNMITILAGYLQGSKYSKGRPKYMNYGTLGRIIGHEISHCFDKNGIYYDKNGKWAPFESHGVSFQVYHQHHKISECLIDHYNGYKYPILGKQLDGKKTEKENMADVNGIRIAYYAYQKWIKDNGPEPTLPYANFTANQLYWISFAHAYCLDLSGPGYPIFDSVHPTDDIRVMGSVTNSPEFAADFNCPVGSKMNQIRKCIF